MDTDNRIKVYNEKRVTDNADLFLDTLYSYDGHRTLVYHHREYHQWIGTHWINVDEDEITAQINKFFKHGYTESTIDGEDGQKKLVKSPFPVNDKTRTNIKNAVKNEVLISYSGNQTNHWIDATAEEIASGELPNADDLIPMQNGILNSRTRELLPRTPRLFNKYVLQFDYGPNPEMPVEWLAFLHSTFENDEQRIGLIQEMLGYLCTPDLSQQKMFYLIGLKRGGKGTITRLIDQLVGHENVGSTSLASLGGAFGLQSIADNPVVVMGDAASSGKTPEQAMERLLGIVGMDKVPVNRKNQKEISATLPGRFVVSANKLPMLPDSSGALRARILVIRFNQSFLGREDKQLGAKIAAELSGIFVWALDGLDRLRERGSFVQPDVGKEELAVYEEITSPELSFIEECCEVGPELRVPKEEMWRVWRVWHEQNSHPLPIGGKGGLTQALTTHHPQIRGDAKTSRAEDGSRQPAYSGITLNVYAVEKYGAKGCNDDLRMPGY